MSPYEPPAWLPCDAAFSALADRYARGDVEGGPSLTPSELARLVLVLESNAFPLGLYSAAAKVNHTCTRPNCRAFQASDPSPLSPPPRGTCCLRLCPLLACALI